MKRRLVGVEMYCFLSFPFIAALANLPHSTKREPQKYLESGMISIFFGYARTHLFGQATEDLGLNSGIYCIFFVQELIFRDRPQGRRHVLLPVHSLYWLHHYLAPRHHYIPSWPTVLTHVLFADKHLLNCQSFFVRCIDL